ncbi:hypothetical protein N7475_008761 [Penicillium sp. IBT 31633x]|nr:hypothetical protein N7475_008761 [Penicillium sp. IBT 31633x]
MPKSSPSPFLPSPLLFPSPLQLDSFIYFSESWNSINSIWDDCHPIICAIFPSKPAPAFSSLRASRAFVHSQPSFIPTPELAHSNLARTILVKATSAHPACLYMA